MRISLIGLLLFCLSAVNSISAQTIDSLFKAMPESIIYGISPTLNNYIIENREDSTRSISTPFYSKVDRKELTDDFLALQTSEAGYTSMKLLPLVNGSKVICVIKTVDATIADSKVYFYTDKWQMINDPELFPTPTLEWFLKSDLNKTDSRYAQLVDALNLMLPVKAIANKDNSDIILEYNPKSYLSIEDYKKIEPFLNKEPIVLEWDKKHYKKKSTN